MLTTLRVDAAQDGSRLDAALHGARLPGGGTLSRRQARDLCALLAVAVDGVCAPATQRLRAGQSIRWQPEHAELALRLGVAVAHADAAVLVLHKPAGLAVHGGPLVAHAVADALARELPGAGLAQRLDREASGLLLVGLDAGALRALGTAMERGLIEREYLAVTAGDVGWSERTIDLPLTVTDEPRGDRPKTVVDENGQRAVSHATVVLRSSRATVVRVRLETGRTHQIRAHLAAVGHPLLGDPRYGDPAVNAAARATHGVHRTMLHGARLRLPHPLTAAPLAIEAALPADFARLFPGLAAAR